MASVAMKRKSLAKKKARRAVAKKLGHSLEHKLGKRIEGMLRPTLEESMSGVRAIETKPSTTYVFKLGFKRSTLSGQESFRTEIAATHSLEAVRKITENGTALHGLGWELVFLDRLEPPGKSSQAW